MNLEKLESLVQVMTNEQYYKFQNAVMSLVTDNIIFSDQEIVSMEKKIQRNQIKNEEVLKEEYSISNMNMAAN